MVWTVVFKKRMLVAAWGFSVSCTFHWIHLITANFQAWCSILVYSFYSRMFH